MGCPSPRRTGSAAQVARRPRGSIFEWFASYLNCTPNPDGGTIRLRTVSKAPEDPVPIWLESVWQDLGYAVRGFRRTPGPFWIAVLTMALGAGGATAVFSVVDRVLFRALPYAHAERLVWFGM